MNLDICEMVDEALEAGDFFSISDKNWRIYQDEYDPVVDCEICGSLFGSSSTLPIPIPNSPSVDIHWTVCGTCKSIYPKHEQFRFASDICYDAQITELTRGCEGYRVLTRLRLLDSDEFPSLQDNPGITLQDIERQAADIRIELELD